MIADAMKIQRRKSKRQLFRTAADELRELQVQRQQLEDQLETLEDLVAASEESPSYAKLVRLSFGRLRDIERKSTVLDPADTIGHAELKGQWKERFLMTQAHIDILAKKEETLSGLDRIGRALTKLRQKLERE